MARNVKLGNLVLHIDGFHQLRTSREMDNLILKAAQMAATAASSKGLTCRAESSPGRNRARAVVVPADAEDAVESARRPEVLLYALNAARHVL